MTLLRCATIAILGLGLAACPKPRPDDPQPTACEEAGPPKATPLRLLTRAEYQNTVRALLGADAPDVAKDFPKEPLVLGFDNNADLNRVTAEGATRYFEAAETLAAWAVAKHKAQLVSCAAEDLNCGKDFIAKMGRHIFRRALSSDEQTPFNTLFSQTLSAENFDTAVEWTLAALLQSPQFLYRFETGAPSDKARTYKLSGNELASKLSYFLWASGPDEELLQAAESGALDSPEGLRAQAERMLKDARAEVSFERFFALWLNFDLISSTEKYATAFPDYTPDLAQAWRSSLSLYIRNVWRSARGFDALFTSNTLYANNQMGLYGPAVTTPEFQAMTMSSQERSGVLSQPGLLARLSAPDQSSPIRRGIFVLDHVLCQPPPPPPGNAAFVPPPPRADATTRERFAQHSSDDSCAQCHRLIDPVGFGFEQYDGLGRFRSQENGKDVDASGAIVTAREKGLAGPFMGLSELSQKLAGSRQAQDCMSSNWLRFAMGRVDSADDLCSLQNVQAKFAESDGDFAGLMLAIIESDSFLYRAAPETL
ncbi:MAG: DUF1592 domain-containing protein [Myxococcaceae bacterium]|nr:DUF1592 domain-containing protein [Myxococcaceae bacterium]